MNTKKIIFLLCLLLTIQSVQAEGHKDKFMFTLNLGSTAPLLVRHTSSGTSLGLQVDYFLNQQLLAGLNLNYSEYYERPNFAVPAYYGPKNDLRYQWKWYSLFFSGKILFEPGRFSPFFKIGFGFYIPQKVYTKYSYIPDGYEVTKKRVYGKTSPGFNFGLGAQYRVWKKLGIMLSGTINYISNQDKEFSSEDIFTLANFDAGISLAF